MTTKSKILLIAIPVLIAVAVGAYFLSRGTSTAYLNALPKDATALARHDVRALLEEAELTKEETSELLQRYSLLEDNKADIGVDFSLPIYLFAGREGNFGLVAPVTDGDDLTAWLKNLAAKGHASEVMQQRGYSWVVVEEKWVMAFDDEKAVAMGPAVGAPQDQLRTIIAQLMKQGADESALQTELYQLLGTKNDPLVAAVRPELLPKDMLGALSFLDLKTSQQGLFRLSLEPDDEELELDIDIISDDPDVQAELKKVNALLRPIAGRLVDNAHTQNALWMALNTQGEELLKVLRSDASLRTTLLSLNFIVDVDRMIQAIDGDVTLELMSAKATPETGGNLQFNFDFKDATFLAQVSNTDFLSGASSWGNTFINVTPLSLTEYVVNIEPSPIHFGVKDKTLYVSAERGPVTEGNAYLRNQRDDIHGARFYATLNLTSIPLEPVSILSKIYPDLSRLDVKMGDAGEFTFTLKASDDTNILRTLLRL